ncbi:MAG: NYN domain-containing protein [Rikenellaceae bacterium]|nr:NYN domain-containing protein [Rikenellaceae bacterium]
MANFSRPLRIGVFYDGNFLLHASNYYNYFHPQRRRLSIGGLHEYIKKRVAEEEECDSRRCQIVESHYFRGRINAAEAAQRGNQLYNDRVFEDILMAEGISTHYLPLRNFSGRKEERGIDVWLSLEVYEYALTGKIDVAVLIVSDTDYAPLLRKLSSLGVSVMLMSWEFDYTNDDGVKVVTKTSHELLQLATYPIPMHDEIEDGLEDNDPDITALFVDNDGPREEEGSKSYNSKPRERSEILSIKNGFGFVKYPNNNLYFHMQDVVGDFFDLAPGDPVEFVIDKNQQKQDVAKSVRKLAD